MNQEEREVLDTVLQEIQMLRADLKVSQRPILTREEAADYVGISARSLHSLFEAGELKRVEMGQGRVGYLREELNRFLKANEVHYHDEIGERGKRLFRESRASA
ncbi:MAG: helix-turn-helix domain-containing protein [Candidatus Hydrogenedentes bacterium]|nr:helix-turn-helix domain-containing protein [Candidatus Hydrogenedentota bacterium]